MSKSKPNESPKRHEFELQEFELQEFLSISNYFFVLFFFLFDRALDSITLARGLGTLGNPRNPGSAPRFGKPRGKSGKPWEHP